MTSIAPPGSGPPSEQPQAGPPQPPPVVAAAVRGRAGWHPWTAPATLLTWFALTIVLGLIVAGIGLAMGYPVKDPPPGVNIASTFLQDGAMIAAVLIFASMAGRPLSADFGLVRTPIGRAISGLLAVWVAFFVFSAAWKAAVSLTEQQSLPDDLGINGSALNLVLVLVVITVLAPVCEEFLFRGYIFGTLRNWQGVVPGAIVTGLIFGAVHIGSSPIGYAVPLAFFGFGLCLLFERTGSLYPGIALHALNNSLALGVDQKWGWAIAPAMIGSVTVALALAVLLGRAIDRRAQRSAGPLPQPAV